MSNWIPTGPAILFAPADRPERFAKAAERADMVIIDLEDGCQPQNRPAGREAVTAADLDPTTTIIRVSSGDSDDLAAVRASPFRQVMLPKVEASETIDAFITELPDAQIICLIESPLGILRAEQAAAHPAVVAMFWGAEDLTAGLGGTASRFADGTYRDIARHSRAHVQLTAAAHNKAALDSIHADISDTAGLRDEASDAAALGYAGTCCIHPAQVPVIREAYRPAPDDLDRAERLLAEAENNRGAFSFEGRMVDEPLFRQAQAIVRRGAISTVTG